MNKSELFKQAHALTKATIKAGDSYRVTFGLAIKAILSKPTTSIVDTLLAMGLKVWGKAGLKRIYMDCAQFNTATGKEYRLSNAKNKFFYDFEKNAIVRLYNHKEVIESQF